MDSSTNKMYFSVYQWLSKLYFSILHRKLFKRLESKNCAVKSGAISQVLAQRKLEVSEGVYYSNTSTRTIHLKKLEGKINPHLSIVANHLSSNMSLSSHVRKQLIKFIGARLPRPHYDRSALPSLVCESKSTATSGYGSTEGSLSSSNVTPSAVRTKVQRGELIEDWQLPVSLRRKHISEEECHAINNGGAYGLGST